MQWNEIDACLQPWKGEGWCRPRTVLGPLQAAARLTPSFCLMRRSTRLASSLPPETLPPPAPPPAVGSWSS